MSGLLVSEVFGPTFQGEGPQTGRFAHFLRLGLCNLDCKWCDTKYTWDWEHFDREKELNRWSIDALVDDLTNREPGLLVITGGEPMVQHLGVRELLSKLSGPEVAVETNGTLDPGAWLLDRVDHWTVSPKMPGAGCDVTKALKADKLRLFAHRPNVCFKFVIARLADVEAVERVTYYVGIVPSRVWLMPEGTSDNQVRARLKALAPVALDHGWNLSGRLHVTLWGDERGR